jgi:hypothetical protein
VVERKPTPNRTEFRYDPVTDIVVATPHWRIETSADVVTWFAQFESYLVRFHRRMDFIVVLDDFEIAPQIAIEWGEVRARLHQRFTRWSFRVHPTSRVKLTNHTSDARYDVRTNEAATVADAVRAIQQARRSGSTR